MEARAEEPDEDMEEAEVTMEDHEQDHQDVRPTKVEAEQRTAKAKAEDRETVEAEGRSVLAKVEAEQRTDKAKVEGREEEEEEGSACSTPTFVPEHSKPQVISRQLE